MRGGREGGRNVVRACVGEEGEEGTLLLGVSQPNPDPDPNPNPQERERGAERIALHERAAALAEREACFDKAQLEAACAAAIEYCLEHVSGSSSGELDAAILNPFCGQGSVLAVANAYGLDAVGMDVSLKCCRIAAEHCVQTV